MMQLKREEILTVENVAAIREHACKEYPNECVGVVTIDGYIPLENTSDQPTISGEIDKKVYLSILASTPILAFVHSHPNGPNCPSGKDMFSQMEMAVPFVIISTNGQACLQPIIWGDQLEPPALDLKGFIHGVQDCYERIRHFGMLHGFGEFDNVTLDNFPRDWQWWLKGSDLYRDNFKDQGWKIIPFEEREARDALLLSIRSPVPNHGGVLIEKDVMYHLSTGEMPFEPMRSPQYKPINNFKSFSPMCLRYIGK